MGNNKKSSRSSRGRSTYVKTMQRSKARTKRIRKDDTASADTAKGNDTSIMVKGMVTGAVAGLIAGIFMGNSIILCLAGAIVGGVVGCIGDLIQTKGLFKKKEK